QAVAVAVDTFTHRPDDLAVGPRAETCLLVGRDVADAEYTREEVLPDVHAGRRRVAGEAGAAGADRLQRRAAVAGPVAFRMAVHALQDVDHQVAAAFDELGRRHDPYGRRGLLPGQEQADPGGPEQDQDSDDSKQAEKRSCHEPILAGGVNGAEAPRPCQRARSSRMPFSVTSRVAPTSESTASQSVAMPGTASASTASLSPRLSAMFCLMMLRVWRLIRRVIG